MRQMLILLAALLLMSACSKPVTHSEVTRAIESVKAPSPIETPAWPEDIDLEIAKNRLDKAYEQLTAKVVGRESILELKHMFPRVNITVFKGAPLSVINAKLLEDNGWQLRFTYSQNEPRAPKTLTYDYCSLAELVYDLSELLKVEVYADFSNKTIYFTNRLTKTFYLPVIPGQDTIEMRNTPSSLKDIGGSTGGQGGADSEESGRFEFQYDSRDTLEELKRIVQSFDEVEQVILNKATSELTVTASIEAMLNVERTIRKTINEFSKQVDLYITIVEVRWSSDEDRSRFFEYMKTRSDKQYQVKIGNVANVSASSAVSFAFSKTDPLETIQNVLNLTNSLGKTKVIANTRTLAQNGAPVTLFSGNIVEYVKSTTITFQQDRQVVTPVMGTVSDGLTLHVLPKILDDNHILLNIIPRLASVDFKTYTFGSSTFELPRSRVHQHYARFVAEDGVVNVFGGLQSVSKAEATTEVDTLGVGISNSSRGERKDVLFIVYGKIVDLSGKYIYQ